MNSVPATIILSLFASAAGGPAAGSADQPEAVAAAAERIPRLPFQKYTLPNGLDVILHQDHSVPIVCVNVWYHVGSKNERPGRTGFAHLFEHMMFQGSQHYDDDYFKPLQEAGGQLNGSTTDDRTNYWELVPSNYLELALWMESDRMGFLLPAMSQQKLDNQRDVVKNERRQSYENRPYGLAYETILAALYPPDHPYSWPTIGSMADLTAASREDVAAFFRRYYHPANASLCIAGDFEPAEAKRLVNKYFGSLPAGPKVARMKPWVPQLAEQKRIRMTDRVGLPRLYMAWHTVPLFATDDAELDVLADVLAAGKTSRLYRSLVYEKQIAQDVEAYQNSSELAGVFHIRATARPGRTVGELEEAVLAEIGRIQEQPPDRAEVERAVNHYEARLITRLQSVGGFGGRADKLNMYNVYAGDPGYLQKDFARYLRVDPQDVQRVAAKYLTDKRVVLTVVPGRERSVEPDPRVEAAAARQQLAKRLKPEPVPAPGQPAAEQPDRSRMPPPGPVPTFRLPPIRHYKLSNGLPILLVEHHELPIVNLGLVVRAGRAADPLDKLGLAGLVAATLDEGTERRTGPEIANELANIGATLSVRADWDTLAIRMFTLKRHLPAALDLYADVVLHPSFPAPELERQRGISLGRLVRMRDEPTVLASLATEGLLYGQQHPYGRPRYGTPKTLRAIRRQDLLSFYRRHVRPDRAALIVVGDVTPAEIVPALEAALAAWQAPSQRPPKLALPTVHQPEHTRIVLIDKPGAAQSVITVCQIGAARRSPDYFPLVVMNTVFGGAFSSRLNMNLREDKGYTYGARSYFDWRVRQPGPFLARASVQTAVTAPAVAEFWKELEGITGRQPIATDELEFAKTYITRSYPASFETPRGIASRLETLIEYDLPDDYYNTVIPGIRAVTAEQAMQAARQHLHLDHMLIIVVGDRERIESALQALPMGKQLTVLKFNDQFHLVPATE